MEKKKSKSKYSLKEIMQIINDWTNEDYDNRSAIFVIAEEKSKEELDVFGGTGICGNKMLGVRSLAAVLMDKDSRISRMVARARLLNAENEQRVIFQSFYSGNSTKDKEFQEA